MRYVVLSFDDGRKDFYTNAFPILKKYHIPATLNIVTEFLGKKHVPGLSEADGECINMKELATMLSDKDCELEIASHSSDHSNSIESIKKSVSDLVSLGCVVGGGIGFASPFSDICSENYHKYKKSMPEQILYVRSGNQIRRDGLIYAVLWALYRITKSNTMFRVYNQRNIIDNQKFDPMQEYFPSVSCCADNNITQLTEFIEKLPDHSSIVICFHSIIDYKLGGKFYNSVSDFEYLCKYLYNNKNICVVTNKALIDVIQVERRMINK